MDDVDLALPDDLAKTAEDRRIERVRFDELDVVEGESRGPHVDAEDVVAPIAEVAHGDLESRRIGTRRPQQDRLFGPAAGAANASQFENANGLHDAATV